MRILGLDYGEKRIGYAVADANVPVAAPRGIFENNVKVFEALMAFCRKEGVFRIVVGLPLTLRGEEGEMARRARAFGARLAEATGLPVDFIDERLTSQGLDEGTVQSVDAAAAARILQEWLDRRGLDRQKPKEALE